MWYRTIQPDQHRPLRPRADARDAVFFMHGILDTSLGWVSNGVAGSSAFAAFDAGFDVWLGNSRANPPFLHESASDHGLIGMSCCTDP